MDDYFDAFDINDIMNAIPTGEKRPQWAKIKPWWDSECDKSLLVGVYKHGYGRYEAIVADSTLCIGRKLNDAISATTPTNINATPNATPTNANTPNTNTITSDGVVDTNDDENFNVDIENENDDDHVDDDTDRRKSRERSNFSPHAINDIFGNVQDREKARFHEHMTKLLHWLVTIDAARNVIKSSKPIKKYKSKQIRQVEEAMEIDETIEDIDDQDDDTFMGINTSTIEDEMFLLLSTNYDIHAVSLAYKQNVGGFRKCEEKAKSPYTTSKSQLQDDAKRLCCIFIIFGAPLSSSSSSSSTNSNNNLNVELQSMLGITSSTVPMMSWADFKRVFMPKHSIKRICTFYESVWLPFVVKITRQGLHLSGPLSRIIPNPYKGPTEHHVSSRGLAFVFLQRQQILRGIHYFITERSDYLIEYLHGPYGREVEGMPVWWCPWVHDLALLVGCLKHGFLYLEKIITDDELPFNLNSIGKTVTHITTATPSTTPNTNTTPNTTPNNNTNTNTNTNTTI